MDTSFPPEFQGKKPVCAIDFDGVVHNDHLGFHDGTCYGAIIEGAREALEIIHRDFDIVIHTAKAKTNRPRVNGQTGIELVRDWLEKNGLIHLVSEVTAEKPRAAVYIDDRAYRFENWKTTLEFLSNMGKS
jgi:hypothetical protein